MSVIFSSVNEEIVYRKVIFGYLDKKFGFWAGAVLSSLIFALSHYNYAGWIGFLTIGLVWCWAYKRTENIAINILSHMALNLIFFIKITFMGG
ncbi:CPBP family intramembrane glutamic endopeptidase [Paenibacillus elgii]|uniref:CPBP family intramembrane glutamic endopeptidase n=1 Tax=Paenibacillus elgii TaxID=189691 RepID=UPI0034DB3A6C